MVRKKKTWPAHKIYEKIHSVLNKEAVENPGKSFNFDELVTMIGYEITAKGILNSKGKVMTSLSKRLDEVMSDITYRLKKHKINWKVKEGRKKATRYSYKEKVIYDFPAECETEKEQADLELFKDVVGYTQTPFSKEGIKRNIISFSTNNLLGKISLVNDLFVAIRERKVVEFTYTGMHSNKPKTHIISPHYLKEYNMRWFLFGREEDESLGEKQKERNTFFVDRIDDEIQIRTDLEYHDPKIDYSKYFDDIIGVTHWDNNAPIDIDITTFNQYTHDRILSKPIHEPQEEIKPFDDKEGTGLIRIKGIRLNQELETQLLSYGDAIKASWEGNSYDNFLERINHMFERYNIEKFRESKDQKPV